MADLEIILKEYGVQGCGDGFCFITGRRKGQHTNGGCSCLRAFKLDTNNRIKLEKILRVLHTIAERA